MKAKDLMIGDWVYNTFNQQAEQVVEIRQDQVILAYNDGNDYDEIEPIPLTPEILEKNGFEPRDSDEEFEVLLNYGEWCYINEDGFEVIGDGADIKYVHQLQHALRLCGIEKEIEL